MSFINILIVTYIIVNLSFQMLFIESFVFYSLVQNYTFSIE